VSVEPPLNDAPAGVPAHRPTRGSGELVRIRGSLNPPVDSVDTYAIRITDPSIFYATLNPGVDTLAGQDGQHSLFLWSSGGQPLLATYVHSPTLASPALYSSITFGGVSAEAGSVSLTAGQIYLLSVARQNWIPVDTLSNNLFGFGVGLEGPSNTAGAFDRWDSLGNLSQSSGQGFYVVALQGATFAELVPEPTAFVIWAALTALVCSRRRSAAILD
jgi:hypothetical protein